MRLACLSLVLVACAPASPTTSPKPAPLPGPALGTPRSCDTTLELQRALALDDEAAQVERALAAASCDEVSAPRTRIYLTRTLLQRAVRDVVASAEQRGGAAASLDLVRLWAVANTRRAGGLMDVGVALNVEAEALTALEQLQGALSDAEREEVGAWMDATLARRPPLDLDGELWTGWMAGNLPASCSDVLTTRLREIDTAWKASEELALQPSPEVWRMALQPRLICTRHVDDIAVTLQDLDRDRSSRAEALRASL